MIWQGAVYLESPTVGTRTQPTRSAWSTFNPHAIGTELFATVSSGASFAQVAGAILRKHARVQNPDSGSWPAAAPDG
jgi:hypothetical protein